MFELFKSTLLFKTLPRRIPYVAFLTGITLGIWLLLRLILSLKVGWGQVDSAEILGAFATGFWFDVATLSYLLVPWLLVSALIPDCWSNRRWLNKMRWVLAFFVCYALIFGAVSEFIFWQEFSTRFNFIAVDYLVYTHEVVGNIMESYPVPLILLLIALFVLTVLFVLGQWFRFETAQHSLKRRVTLFILAVLLPVFSYKLANVDQMQFSKNAYANELAGNGLFSFAAAVRRNELDYDKFYKTIPQAQADEILKKNGLLRHAFSKAISRETEGLDISNIAPFKRRPKNVIVVMVESLSADYLGTYGNKENLTPYLDKLAQESLVFDKVFATGTRTVRGLDALSIAIPPIPGQAIVHRPDSDHLATLGEFLEAQQYSTFFMYGGYGVFDSMNAYFRGNDYKVVDRTDFDKSTIQAENVWGIDDESLFNNSISMIDRMVKPPQPFYAHIMTTSNHRPFTFPEGKIDLPQGHREGAVKYTDYAIGKLIENAKTKPWFKDTLFVIVADHCSSAAGKTKLPVDKYRIPLFFYAPDLLPAGHYSRVVSQIDIAPTILDILGAKGSQHFFGQSLFKAEREQAPQRAFISNYQELGYYKDNSLIVLSPKQKAEFYHVDPLTFESKSGPMNQALLDEAIAYYQTAARAYKRGDLNEDKNLY